FINFHKTNFIGKEALKEEKPSTSIRRLIGLEMIDRSIPRAGYRVFSDGLMIGQVTSGSYCPTLEKNLAMALVSTNNVTASSKIEVEIRGKLFQAKQIPLPFYSRQKGV